MKNISQKILFLLCFFAMEQGLSPKFKKKLSRVKDDGENFCNTLRKKTQNQKEPIHIKEDIPINQKVDFLEERIEELDEWMSILPLAVLELDDKNKQLEEKCTKIGDNLLIFNKKTEENINNVQNSLSILEKKTLGIDGIIDTVKTYDDKIIFIEKQGKLLNEGYEKIQGDMISHNQIMVNIMENNKIIQEKMVSFDRSFEKISVMETDMNVQKKNMTDLQKTTTVATENINVANERILFLGNENQKVKKDLESSKNTAEKITTSLKNFQKETKVTFKTLDDNTKSLEEKLQKTSEDYTVSLDHIQGTLEEKEKHDKKLRQHYHKRFKVVAQDINGAKSFCEDNKKNIDILNSFHESNAKNIDILNNSVEDLKNLGNINAERIQELSGALSKVVEGFSKQLEEMQSQNELLDKKIGYFSSHVRDIEGLENKLSHRLRVLEKSLGRGLRKKKFPRMLKKDKKISRRRR